jgi:AraC-like DNA-binding protein
MNEAVFFHESELAMRDDGSLNGTLELGSPASAGCDAAAIYRIDFIQRGHAIYPLPTGTLKLAAGQMRVINPDERGEPVYSDDCEKFSLRIPESLFSEVCAEHRWGKPTGRIAFQPLAYEFGGLDRLLPVLHLLCQELESGLATPQILQHYNFLIASKLLSVLRHNVSLSAQASASVQFERLVRFIEANLKRDISVEELAQHAHISPRSLYLLFEKHAKATPKEFIRQKKLGQVYANLMNPASALSNVTAVALEYGFTHLGRFSEFYKTTFGVLPSESLKMRQARGFMSRHGHA